MEPLRTLPGTSDYYYFNPSSSSVDRICVCARVRACVCAHPAHLLGYGKCVSSCVLYSSVGGFPCEEVELLGLCVSSPHARRHPIIHTASATVGPAVLKVRFWDALSVVWCSARKAPTSGEKHAAESQSESRSVTG